MKNNAKKYLIILAISLIVLIFEIFLIKMGGAFGLIICLLSMYFFVGSLIRLLRLSNYFDESFMELIDILFL